MSFYLTALDRQVKLPHENRSIGIILCREKTNTVVEYAIGDASQQMGVATYKLMPPEIGEVLPTPDDLTRLINAPSSPPAE